MLKYTETEIRRRLIEGLRFTVPEVIETMAYCEAQFIGQDTNINFALSSEIAAMIRLYGGLDGMIAITSEELLVRTIVSRILGAVPEDLTSSDLLDGIAELINMVCGGMKTKAQINHIHLSPPLAIIGNDYTAVWKTDQPPVVMTFQVDNHVLKIHAGL